ncbi:MAG: hypothetical protein KKE57_11160 [Proteobacteria bacterium]|nr:hypothetical protein [Pseudomonadota bacterium]
MPLLEENLISSKEVMSETGISRATLNNYIKMGILPRPVVKRPDQGMKGVKQIGYFPREVLVRIEKVRQLKLQGKAMDQIVSELQGAASLEEPPLLDESEAESEKPFDLAGKRKTLICGKTIGLTLENISMPAYLMDYDFEITWINPGAQTQILRQELKRLKEGTSRNIFKIFFNWEFHNHVRNWLDIVAFHMSFAKLKYARSWLKNLFQGISESEVNLLQQIYDRVRPFRQGTIGESHINLFIEDGSTKTYRVYTVFTREGIFFLYAPENFLDLSDVKESL